MTNPSTALPGMLAERVLRWSQEHIGLDAVSFERSDSFAGYAGRISRGIAYDSQGPTKIIICSGPHQSNATAFVSNWVGPTSLSAPLGGTAFIGCSYGRAGTVSETSGGFFVGIVGSSGGQAHGASGTATSGGISIRDVVHLDTAQELLGWPLRGQTSSESLRENWLKATRTELRETLEDAQNLEGADATTLSNLAEVVLRECALLQVSLPTIDLDHDGNLEFFWKKKSEGLLAVVRVDGSLHFFGSSNSESWRSSYQMLGHVWRNHLRTLFGPFTSDAEHP